jgi:hypothetical protein
MVSTIVEKPAPINILMEMAADIQVVIAMGKESLVRLANVRYID